MKRPNRNIRAVISYQVPPKLFTNWTYSAMTESTVHAQVTKVIRKQASSTSCHLSWCRMHSLPCALGRHIHLLQVRFNWPVYVPLRSAASCGGSGPPPPHLIHGSLDIHESAPQQHLNQFSCFGTAHPCDKHADRHTHRLCYQWYL